jgi:hypothetical protein
VWSIPPSAFSTEILVDAGCSLLRSGSADRPQRGCTVVTDLLLSLGQYIPLGDSDRILQFHTRNGPQSDHSWRTGFVLPGLPSALSISGVPIGDPKPVHRRRVPCRRSDRSPRVAARDAHSTNVPVELRSSPYPQPVVRKFRRPLAQNELNLCHSKHLIEATGFSPNSEHTHTSMKDGLVTGSFAPGLC